MGNVDNESQAWEWQFCVSVEYGRGITRKKLEIKARDWIVKGFVYYAKMYDLYSDNSLSFLHYLWFCLLR